MDAAIVESIIEKAQPPVVDFAERQERVIRTVECDDMASMSLGSLLYFVLTGGAGNAKNHTASA